MPYPSRGKKIPQWLHEETLYLEERIGSVFTERLIDNFQQRSARLGLSKRSRAAILHKIKAIARQTTGTRCCVDDNLPQTRVAELLGISCNRVRKWVKYNGLPATKFSRSIVCVAIDDFYDWAYFTKNQPLLKDCDRDGLLWLLKEDERLVKRIENAPTIDARVGKLDARRKVKRLDTGETFSSLKEASEKTKFPLSTIWAAINHQRDLAGCFWDYAD